MLSELFENSKKGGNDSIDMLQRSELLINLGIYLVPEASKLTRVSTGRIRRWLKGYRYAHGNKRYTSPPVWVGDIQPIDGKLALSFLDMMEVRLVDAFLKQGVSWKTLRAARSIAREEFKLTHPFCSNRFATDGREIFLKLSTITREEGLLNITRHQHVFADVIRPFLKGVEFLNDQILRWWPLGQKKSVVIDPRRSFGQPVVSREGVPTVVLFKALKATGSLSDVVKWFEVSESAVRDAAEFEAQLAA